MSESKIICKECKQRMTSSHVLKLRQICFKCLFKEAVFFEQESKRPFTSVKSYVRGYYQWRELDEKQREEIKRDAYVLTRPELCQKYGNQNSMYTYYSKLGYIVSPTWYKDLFKAHGKSKVLADLSTKTDEEFKLAYDLPHLHALYGLKKKCSNLKTPKSIWTELGQDLAKKAISFAAKGASRGQLIEVLKRKGKIVSRNKIRSYELANEIKFTTPDLPMQYSELTDEQKDEIINFMSTSTVEKTAEHFDIPKTRFEKWVRESQDLKSEKMINSIKEADEIPMD